MDDLISRQDAIDAIGNVSDYGDGMVWEALSHAQRDVALLPSAEPKTGKWVKVIDEETPNVVRWHYECDQCGAGRWEKGQRYCQNCGVRMKDGEA